MSKKPADPNATPAKPRAKRTRAAKYFLATWPGSETPTLSAAFERVITLKPATPLDLVDAGRNGYAVIDATAAKE
jgi:hypothetical protein